MQITRLTALNDSEARGCATAFADSLEGELNAAALHLRKLEGARKGSAFAFEMSLDRHRYAALIVLDRWAELARVFGAHAPPPLEGAGDRSAIAEEILRRANDVIDESSDYGPDIVGTCLAAFQAIRLTFGAEREAAEQAARLGPMLPEDFARARRIFAQDLAAR